MEILTTLQTSKDQIIFKNENDSKNLAIRYCKMNEIRIIPIEGIPEIKVNDNLVEITFDVLSKSRLVLRKMTFYSYAKNCI